MDEITEWWEYLETSEKVAAVWLAIVAVAVITLGFLFPIFGLIALGLGTINGTIWAIIKLVESRW